MATVEGSVERSPPEGESFFVHFHKNEWPKVKDFNENLSPCLRQSASRSHDKTIVLVKWGSGGAQSATPPIAAVAPIQIYFEGRNFFPHREGDEARGPKGRERGWGYWGWGSGEGAVSPSPKGQSAPYPPARGLGEHCKLPNGVRVGTPRKFEIWCNLRPQNSLQNCLITFKLLKKG